MGGSIHFNKQSKRWVISVYWEKKRYFFWKHPVTSEPFWHEKQAEKQLMRIRTEIDEGYFNPRTWLPDSPLSVSSYAMEWLQCIDVSHNTLKDYRNSVINYIIPFFENKDIRRIRYSDIVKFHKSINRSDKGKYNVVSCLKTMLRFAWRNEDIRSVPPFPTLKFQLPTVEYLTFEQQNKIIEFIPNIHKPIFYFMQEYGCRPGEARALMKDCITENEIVIKRAFADNLLQDKTKTGTERIYPITPFFHDVLNSIPTSFSKFVFVRKDGKPYEKRQLPDIWRRACEKAEIKIKMYNAFRHSLGCQLLDQGEDLDLVREQLGHTKMEMTRRYAKRSPTRLADALNKRRKVVELPLSKESKNER